MTIQAFPGGRIRKADYNESTKQLELHFDTGTVLAYKQVPGEVFRRLCSAPNAATYWEDRIADEYPKGTPLTKPQAGGKTLKDLFGDLPDE